MLYVTACFAGVFALDENFRTVAFELFPKDPGAIAERLHVLQKGQITPELEEVLSQIGDKHVVTDLTFEFEGLEIEYQPENPGARYVQENLRKIALETRFVSDATEFNTLLSEIARLETKERMRVARNDKFVAQAVAAIEDLTEITNVMSERLHEWYGLYHPELERHVRDNERYAKAVVEGAKREEGSVGTYVHPEDLEQIKRYAARTAEMFATKSEIEGHLARVVPGVAPNTSAVAGPLLAARLIRHAGSLERLAKMPASTIQLLGAEKALFRFMKQRKAGGREAERARLPKYGLIFAHPAVQKASQDRRGKVARALAAKISIAAKTDFYSGEDRSSTYVKDLGKKIKEILKER